MSDATLTQIARKMAEQIFDLQAAGRIMHESWTETKRAQRFHGPNEICEWPACGATDSMGTHICSRRHADLIPWDDLPQKQKDINLNAFRDVFAVLTPKSEAAIREAMLLALQKAEQITRDEDGLDKSFATLDSELADATSYNHACKHIRDAIAELKSELIPSTSPDEKGNL